MTTRADIEAFEARKARLYELLATPQHSDELDAVLQCGIHSIRRALSVLNNEGRVVFVGNNAAGMWCRVEDRQKVCAIIKARADEKLAEWHARSEFGRKCRRLAARGLASLPGQLERSAEAAAERKRKKAHLLQVVLAAGADGISRQELRKIVGLGDALSLEMTAELQRLRLIDSSQRTGGSTRWGPWGVIRKTQRPVSKPAVRVDDADPRQDEVDSWPISRSIVPAAQTAPPPRLGPASVWQLGVMA